jgi:HPt (histidine-containing phosphotransfer) domain-containing protein
MGYDDDPDEGSEQLLGEMLDSMRDMVRVYTSRLQDRVEELEEEVDSQQDRIGVLKWEKDRDRTLLKDIKALVWNMPRADTDTEIVAKIRGMLHG